MKDRMFNRIASDWIISCYSVDIVNIWNCIKNIKKKKDNYMATWSSCKYSRLIEFDLMQFPVRLIIVILSVSISRDANKIETVTSKFELFSYHRRISCEYSFWSCEMRNAWNDTKTKQPNEREKINKNKK